MASLFPGHRIGRLQSSILRLLAEKPRTVDALHAELPTYRRDNVLRSVKVLERSGRVVGDDAATPTYAVQGGVPIPDATPTREVAVPRNEYTALTVAFLLLSQGSPRAPTELFPPHTVTRKFALRALESLLQLDLIEPAANGCFVIKNAQAFKSTWADERRFCAVLGKECSTEQAYSMSLLLSGNGSLREDAAAAAVLYEDIGQENTARRTGLSTPTVTALRRVASLAPEVQEAMEANDLGARWILSFPADVSSSEVMAAIAMAGIAGMEHEAEEEPGAADAEPGNAELLATCVKLCAFTADAIARMESKLTFLANELGYRERE